MLPKKIWSAMLALSLGILLLVPTLFNTDISSAEETKSVAGTIHWRIAGIDSQELRELILETLDNAIITDSAGTLQPNDTSQGRHLGEIDEAEVLAYVGFANSYLQHYLEGDSKDIVDSTTHRFETLGGTDRYNNGKPLCYEGRSITHSALANNNIYTDTAGLILQTSASTSRIDIHMVIVSYSNCNESWSIESIKKVPFEPLLIELGRDYTPTDTEVEIAWQGDSSGTPSGTPGFGAFTVFISFIAVTTITYIYRRRTYER